MKVLYYIKKLAEATLIALAVCSLGRIAKVNHFELFKWITLGCSMVYCYCSILLYNDNKITNTPQK